VADYSFNCLYVCIHDTPVTPVTSVTPPFFRASMVRFHHSSDPIIFSGALSSQSDLQNILIQ